MSDNYNGEIGGTGPATKTGPSSNSWPLIVAVAVGLIGLGAFTFYGQHRSYKEEKDRLRDLISETRHDSFRTGRLLGDIPKNKRLLKYKQQTLRKKSYVPDPPDFKQMREKLETSAKDYGIKISEFRATGHETEGAVTRTTLLLTYSEIPDYEDVKQRFRSGPDNFLAEWELVSETATSISLKGIAHSIAITPAEQCNAEAVRCGQFESDVWLPPYADEIEKLVTKYKYSCPHTSPEEARDLKNEMCRVNNQINETNEKIKFVEKTILEIEARKKALKKRKKTERQASIQCDPEQAVPFDKEIHPQYPMDEVKFCGKKGKGRAVVAMPGKVNVIVKKGDEISKYGGIVTAIKNDHISCRETYLDPANPYDTYIVDYDIHDEISKLVKTNSVIKGK